MLSSYFGFAVLCYSEARVPEIDMHPLPLAAVEVYTGILDSNLQFKSSQKYNDDVALLIQQSIPVSDFRSSKDITLLVLVIAYWMKELTACG